MAAGEVKARWLMAAPYRSSLPEATLEPVRQNPDRGPADFRERAPRLLPPMAVARSACRRREGHDRLNHRARHSAAGPGPRAARMGELWRLHEPEHRIA